MKRIIVLLLILVSRQAFSQESSDSLLQKELKNMSVKEFKERTSIKNKMVLVSFSADWCVVCKKEKPILEQIRAEKKDVLEVLIIDMEENPVIAEYFDVQSLPVNLLYKKGDLVWNRVGLKTKTELLTQINLFEN